MGMQKGHVHIGTSGWEYPHWRGRFYPEKLPVHAHLDYYARHFKSVEVNNSFYRLPEIKTLRQWHDTVPDDFVFVIKASRFITHMKKLKDPIESSSKLMERIVALESKLGPVLFQLPPNWPCNPDRLAHFLEVMPRGFQYVFELRDPSWLNADIYNLLRTHQAAFCIYEIAGRRSGNIVTSDVVYIRLHGPQKSAYTGCYGEKRLTSLAGDSIGCRKAGMFTAISTTIRTLTRLKMPPCCRRCSARRRKPLDCRL